MEDWPTLQQFVSGLAAEQKQQLAALAGTSVDHLYQLVGGHRRASPRLAQRLVDASVAMFDDPARHLTLASVRPDIWAPSDRRPTSSSSAARP